MKIKYGLDSLQTVIFVSSLDFTDKLDIAQNLKKIKSINIGGEPAVIPLPNDAPLEIPRIMLKSIDQSYSINASPSRIDVIFKNKKYDKDGIPTISAKDISLNLINSTKEIAEILKNKYHAIINRVALITRILIKMDSSSKDYLKKAFLAKLSEIPYEINMAFLYRQDLGVYKVNKWKRFETLRSLKNIKDDTALSFAIDINTLGEINYKFTPDSIEDFIKKASVNIDKDIKKDIDSYV